MFLEFQRILKEILAVIHWKDFQSCFLNILIELFADYTSFFVNRYQICIIPVSSWTLFNVQLDMRSCNWLVAIAIYYKRNISAEHFYSALSFPSINTMNFKLVLYFSLISKISTHPLRRKRHTPDSSLPFGIWSQSISLSEDTFCPSSSVELTSTEWDM